PRGGERGARHRYPPRVSLRRRSARAPARARPPRMEGAIDAGARRLSEHTPSLAQGEDVPGSPAGEHDAATVGAGAGSVTVLPCECARRYCPGVDAPTATQLVFICGGGGTRFPGRPAGAPKSMVELGGEPLLGRLWRQLAPRHTSAAAPILVAA